MESELEKTIAWLKKGRGHATYVRHKSTVDYIAERVSVDAHKFKYGGWTVISMHKPCPFGAEK